MYCANSTWRSIELLDATVYKTFVDELNRSALIALTYFDPVFYFEAFAFTCPAWLEEFQMFFKYFNEDNAWRSIRIYAACRIRSTLTQNRSLMRCGRRIEPINVKLDYAMTV